MTKSKVKPIRRPAPKVYVPLHEMTKEQLDTEIKGLPERIAKARVARDRLWLNLRARWGIAFVNDPDFIKAHFRAEAAGWEVVSLVNRLVKASGVWNDRYSGQLPL